MLISRRRALSALAVACSAGAAERLIAAQDSTGPPRDRLVGTVPLGRFDGRAADGPPTSQRREFAARTHQQGIPARVSEFAPAIIDLAAMPIRVEHWTSQGHSRYRVVGVIWGGTKLTDALLIRFKSNQPFVR